MCVDQSRHRNRPRQVDHFRGPAGDAGFGHFPDQPAFDQHVMAFGKFPVVAVEDSRVPEKGLPMRRQCLSGAVSPAANGFLRLRTSPSKLITSQKISTSTADRLKSW